jgi:hypothetical protein
MPQIKQPNNLRRLCLRNIINNIDSYWLNDQSSMLKKVLTTNFSKKSFLYFIGPFEQLDDHAIHFILKKVYEYNVINKAVLLIFLHNYLRYLNLSFIKKKNLLTADVCSFIGNNCMVKLNPLNNK